MPYGQYNYQQQYYYDGYGGGGYDQYGGQGGGFGGYGGQGGQQGGGRGGGEQTSSRGICTLVYTATFLSQTYLKLLSVSSWQATRGMDQSKATTNMVVHRITHIADDIL